jgi:hypothetical protein
MIVLAFATNLAGTSTTTTSPPHRKTKVIERIERLLGKKVLQGHLHDSPLHQEYDHFFQA